MVPDFLSGTDVKGITYPNEIYMSSDLVKGCPVLINVAWHFTIPEPDPVEQIHSHDFDTILCFIGSNPQNPSNLGAVLEIMLGKEKHIISDTCAVFIPRMLDHGILTHKKLDRAYLKIEYAMTDGEGYGK